MRRGGKRGQEADAPRILGVSWESLGTSTGQCRCVHTPSLRGLWGGTVLWRGHLYDEPQAEERRWGTGGGLHGRTTSGLRGQCAMEDGAPWAETEAGRPVTARQQPELSARCQASFPGPLGRPGARGQGPPGLKNPAPRVRKGRPHPASGLQGAYEAGRPQLTGKNSSVGRGAAPPIPGSGGDPASPLESQQRPPGEPGSGSENAGGVLPAASRAGGHATPHTGISTCQVRASHRAIPRKRQLQPDLMFQRNKDLSFPPELTSEIEHIVGAQQTFVE